MLTEVFNTKSNVRFFRTVGAAAIYAFELPGEHGQFGVRFAPDPFPEPGYNGVIVSFGQLIAGVAVHVGTTGANKHQYAILSAVVEAIRLEMLDPRVQYVKYIAQGGRLAVYQKMVERLLPKSGYSVVTTDRGDAGMITTIYKNNGN